MGIVFVFNLKGCISDNYSLRSAQNSYNLVKCLEEEDQLPHLLLHPVLQHHPTSTSCSTTSTACSSTSSSPTITTNDGTSSTAAAIVIQTDGSYCWRRSSRISRWTCRWKRIN